MAGFSHSKSITNCEGFRWNIISKIQTSVSEKFVRSLKSQLFNRQIQRQLPLAVVHFRSKVNVYMRDRKYSRGCPKYVLLLLLHVRIQIIDSCRIPNWARISGIVFPKFPINFFQKATLPCLNCNSILHSTRMVETAIFCSIVPTPTEHVQYCIQNDNETNVL